MPKKRKQDRSQPAAIFTIVAFLAVTTILLFTSSNSSITGQFSAVQPISLVEAGTILDFEVRNVDGLKDATAYFSAKVKNAIITFDEVEVKNFVGVVYSGIEVKSADSNKISGIDLTLRVDKKKLSELNLNKNDIVIFVNGQEFKTDYSHDDKFHHYYKVKAVDMGTWIIGVKFPEVETQPAPEESIEEPVSPEPPVQVKIDEPEVEEPEMEEKGFFARFFENFFG
tara:strand:+ start:912 stop:1589 length:678 start_codon:yes stop_codon:yes gene_type:complete